MRKVLSLLLCVLLAHAARAGQPVSPIAYEVTVHPSEKVFHVSVRIEGVSAPNVDFAMPTWTPGYYSVVNFGKWVRNFKATAGDGKELKVEMPNSFTWRISPDKSGKEVNIQYDVAAVTDIIGAELQGSSITSQGAFINSPAVFGYVVGQTARPVTLEFKIPSRWRVATAMAARSDEKKSAALLPSFPPSRRIRRLTHLNASLLQQTFRAVSDAESDAAETSGVRVVSVRPEVGLAETLRPSLVAAAKKPGASPPTPPPAAGIPLNNQPTPTSYTAPNYDTLVDSPIVLGQFQRADLTLKMTGLAGTAPSQPAATTQPPSHPTACAVSLVVQGDSLAPDDWTKLATTVEKIAKAQIGMMQDVPANYLFIFRLNDKADEIGGLEHASSSVIVMPKKTLLENPFGAYTMAQMFFHQWNGKRIRPDYFNNINYAVVPDRPHLWFFKGVTHYFAYLTLLRAGLWKPQEFIEQLAGTKQTPVAIHQRGAHLGLLLDLRLRELTNNEKSLEGFLRHLNETFGKKNQPYGANGILEQLNAYTGGPNPFNEFYDRYVVKEEDLPMDDVLAFAGLKLEERTVRRSDFSVEVASGLKGHVQVASVVSDTPEAKAGLLVGDLILMVDAKNVTKNLEAAQEALKGKKAGDKFTLQVFRVSANKKLNLQGTFEEGEMTAKNIVELPPPTADEQKQNPTLKPQAERRAVIRQGLLRGKNDVAPTVQPVFALVSVTPDKPTVKQDSSVQLQVKIIRNYDYQGEITLMVNGLPANVVAEPVTLEGADTTATITLKAAANAAVANVQNVTVSASTMLGSQPFTQTSAAMTLAVQAK